METDVLALLEELKNVQKASISHPINLPREDTREEILKLRDWINSQDIKPLRPPRKSLKERRQQLMPAGFDWHQVTGFNPNNLRSRQHREPDPVRNQSAIPDVHISTERDSIEENVERSRDRLEDRRRSVQFGDSIEVSGATIGGGRSLQDDSLSSTVTIQGNDPHLSSTLASLLNEQKRMQAQLQQDMRHQEDQFKEQLSKIAEQQRRLIERDTLKDIIQQQQQILLSASNGLNMAPHLPAMSPAPGMFSMQNPMMTQTPMTASMASLSFGGPGTAASMHPMQNIQPSSIPRPGGLNLSPQMSMMPSFNPLSSLNGLGLGAMGNLGNFPTTASISSPSVPPAMIGMQMPSAALFGQGASGSSSGMGMRFASPGIQIDNTRVCSTSQPNLTNALKTTSVHNSVALKTASSASPVGKTTIMQQLQSMQLSDSSDEDGLTSGGANMSMYSTSNSVYGNKLKLDWEPVLTDPQNAWRWKIVVAVMKGWMVRRLMRTEKIQALVTTIRDARDFLADLRYTQEEYPGMTDEKDNELQHRIISQLRAAIFELHRVFFDTPLRAKLDLISHSRRHYLNKRLQGNPSAFHASRDSHSSLSAATLKARERRLHPSGSVDNDTSRSSTREKRAPKRVDCGLRGGFLPKKEPQPPVKLDPRKFYSKHGRSRTRSTERS